MATGDDAQDVEQLRAERDRLQIVRWSVCRA